MILQLDSQHPEAPYGGLRMSADEFLALPESKTHCELVDGVVVIAPDATFGHQRIVTEILFQLATYLEAHPVGEVVADVDVKLGDDLVYRPDIVFVSSAKAARVGVSVGEPPDLIVEIVSPDSRSYDSRTKRDDYEAAGVAEYWLIDPPRRTFRFFVLEGGAYRETPGAGLHHAATVLPGFRLDLERVRRLF